MPKTKEKKKSKGKLIAKIIVGIIIVIALAAIIMINVVTRPSLDTEKYHPVGGMVYSETVEYKSDSSKGIRHNPIIRMFQMIWRFCEDGDNATHAKQTPPTGIKEENDIFYIEDNNVYHKLDVYYPEGKTAKDNLPIIVDIHGGGWMYGDKNLNKYYCLELASKGYVVFNISYRLVPDVVVNDQIQDCMAAMNWINKNAKTYTGSDKMLLTGDSAGGMLAAYTAAIMQSDELQTKFETEKYDKGGLMPSALLLTSPVAFMKSGGAFSVYTKVQWGKDYKKKETYNLMDLNEIVEYATLPPTYLITSDGDSLAHDQTHMAYDLLKEKGIECEIKNFGNDEKGEPLPHVFSVLSPFDKSGQEAINGALEFYQNHIQ